MKITDFLGEATEYDKKQAVEHKKVKSWLKSVSAFANTAGGTLIIGTMGKLIELEMYMTNI